jgi:hypothetical protein
MKIRRLKNADRVEQFFFMYFPGHQMAEWLRLEILSGFVFLRAPQILKSRTSFSLVTLKQNSSNTFFAKLTKTLRETLLLPVVARQPEAKSNRVVTIRSDESQPEMATKKLTSFFGSMSRLMRGSHLHPLIRTEEIDDRQSIQSFLTRLWRIYIRVSAREPLRTDATYSLKPC